MIKLNNNTKYLLEDSYSELLLKRQAFYFWKSLINAHSTILLSFDHRLDSHSF